MRRNDVASTSFRRRVPTSFLINQRQIITFLILKSNNIENSRIELKGIVLPVPSNQIKVTFIIIYLLLFNPSTWYVCDFFLFHIEIEGKCGWISGGGGMVCWPSLSNYWGGGLPRPLSSYAYANPSSSIIRRTHSKSERTVLIIFKYFIKTLYHQETDLASTVMNFNNQDETLRRRKYIALNILSNHRPERAES